MRVKLATCVSIGMMAVDELLKMLNCPILEGCAKQFSHLRVFGRHGDMLFLFPSGAPSSSGDVMDTTGPHSSSSLSSPSASTSSSFIPRSLSAPQVQEDEIDQYLAKQDGKIYRNKDPQLWETTRHKPPHLKPSFIESIYNIHFFSCRCRHGALGKCVHCVPLEVRPLRLLFYLQKYPAWQRIVFY